MTAGELARMIRGKKLLPGLDALELDVQPMEGWHRWMRWQDFSSLWIPTSPAIPSFQAALLYPGICLFEATSINDGRGTTTPFNLIGADWIDQADLISKLNSMSLPGLHFLPAQYTPHAKENSAAKPKYDGVQLDGVRIVVTDYRIVTPVEVGVTMLQLIREQARHKGRANPINQPKWLNYLAGTKRLNDQLESGMTANAIIQTWKNEVARFVEDRKRYLLYD
jgi:uncharacterized protein YbbC (DUF1343 family)